MDDLALEYQDFSFAYPGCECCLGPVNFGVEPRSFVLLTGDTGCGKTTLLRCAKPELAPTGERHGEIIISKTRIEDLSVLQSCELIGYVSQNPDNQLVCSTVWHQMAFGLENLGMPQDEMRRRVAEVAHFFNIEPWFQRDVNELSGGQKQLLNLASILVMRPRVLLLDEPCAQLDPVSEKNFLHALFRLNREIGLTIVMATHSPEAAADYATAAARIENGVVYSRALETLRQKGQVTPRKTTVISQDAAIVLNAVRLRYTRTGPWVLRGVDITIAKGTIHALIGGNACGKSTLLGVMAATLKPERGKVSNKLADSQAFLPQNPQALFVCDCVEEELREWQGACGYSDEEVNRALSTLRLTGHETQHPYDLSGGQQQLLALAKLLLARPRLLLLDEPTKGLDSQAKVQVASLLDAFRAQGGTVVVATHDLTFAAALADKVSLLFDGEVAASEQTADFFRDNLFYRPVADAFWDAWS